MHADKLHVQPLSIHRIIAQNRYFIFGSVSPPAVWYGAGAGRQTNKGVAAIPSSLNIRLAILEQAVSAANKMTLGTRRSISSAALAFPSSSLVAPGASGSAVNAASDIAERVAALEAQLNQLRQPDSGFPTVSSLRHNSVSSTGNSAQPMQNDSAAMSERLSQLQQQVEALATGKANKADLEALQLHAAVMGGDNGGGGSRDDGGGSRGAGGGSSDNGGTSVSAGAADAGESPQLAMCIFTPEHQC